jgi:hypothetical protein
MKTYTSGSKNRFTNLDRNPLTRLVKKHQEVGETLKKRKSVL